MSTERKSLTINSCSMVKFLQSSCYTSSLLRVYRLRPVSLVCCAGDIVQFGHSTVFRFNNTSQAAEVEDVSLYVYTE